MSNEVEQVKKAFHDARIAGEKMLNEGTITWDDFEFVMVGFEMQLKSLGVKL